MCDHARLRDTLAAIKGRAVVSLNDCPETRRLYGGWDIREIGVAYSVGGKGADRKKRNGEVVITKLEQAKPGGEKTRMQTRIDTNRIISVNVDDKSEMI